MIISGGLLCLLFICWFDVDDVKLDENDKTRFGEEIWRLSRIEYEAEVKERQGFRSFCSFLVLLVFIFFVFLGFYASKCFI